MRTMALGAAAVLLLLGGAPGPTKDAAPPLDWSTTLWRHHLTFRTPQFADGSPYFHCRGWHINPIEGRISTPDAPADWMKP